MEIIKPIIRIIGAKKIKAMIKETKVPTPSKGEKINNKINIRVSGIKYQKLFNKLSNISFISFHMTQPPFTVYFI